MRQKIIGAGIAAMLVSLAAVGVFASQDGVNLLDVPTGTHTDALVVGDTPTVTETATATETSSANDTATATATATPTETATPGDTETATVTVTATPTPGGGEDDDTHGIPTSNPSHHPEDGDGECEKGETIVKTTPSGNNVNVPCETQKHDSEGTQHDEENDNDD
jgi:hypothetical protein